MLHISSFLLLLRPHPAGDFQCYGKHCVPMPAESGFISPRGKSGWSSTAWKSRTSRNTRFTRLWKMKYYQIWITDYVFVTVNSRKFSLFLCLYIQNELNLRLLPVNYICCEDAMNAFISSSLGSSIMYFRTKMLGSNPAVVYFTIVSPFSVQSSFEAEAVSHFQFQWLVNKFTSNTIFNIKTKCARNRDFMHILFVSSSLKFQLNRRQAQRLASKHQLPFFIIKVGFSGKSRKRDEFPVS